MLLTKVDHPFMRSMTIDEPNREKGDEADPKKEEVRDLLPLMRILLKNPPPDHDVKTCPICKEHGITEL